MERLVKGDVIAIPFPFSDLKSTVKRPALVLSEQGRDIIVCQITKVERENQSQIILNPEDFREGSLKLKSFIRVSRIFTLEKSLVLYKIGTLKEGKIKEVVGLIIKILEG